MKTTALITILYFLFVSTLFAQGDMKIRGKVIDQNTYEPMPCANVLVKGTSRETTTNQDGEYTLMVSTNEILVFSYLGYKQKEVEVTGQTRIDVYLEDDYPDLGLPFVYYIRSSVFGAASTTYSRRTFGYAFDVHCTLPYTASERYGTSLYDNIKSKLAIGVKLAKITPDDNNLKGSIFLHGDLSEWIGFSITKRCSISPYVTGGLYIDADKNEIKSQNFEYGGGFTLSVASKYMPSWLSFNAGYQGFVKQPSYNNFFVGIRIHALLTPILYY